MKATGMARRLSALGLAAASLALGASATGVTAASGGSWPQWGGPARNFVVESSGLASTWPPAGPRRLWDRALGEGHSAIVSDGSRLYTMYRPAGGLSMLRRSRQEVVAAVSDTPPGPCLATHGRC